MMKDLNVNKVYYSTGNGDEIVYELVKDMISIHTSSITRYLLSLSNIIINKSNYYEKLLITKIPSKIKEKNLLYFLKHNFENILPKYNYIIKNENNNKIVIFYNKDNDFLFQAIII